MREVLLFTHKNLPNIGALWEVWHRDVQPSVKKDDGWPTGKRGRVWSERTKTLPFRREWVGSVIVNVRNLGLTEEFILYIHFLIIFYIYVYVESLLVHLLIHQFIQYYPYSNHLIHLLLFICGYLSGELGYFLNMKHYLKNK